MVKDGEDNIPDIINGYVNIGGCYLKLDQPYKAIESLSTAMQIADQYSGKENIDRLKLSSNTLAARTYAEIGDYDNALLNYSNIIHFSNDKEEQKKGDETEIFKIRALIETGSIQANYLNLPESAITNINKALSLLKLKNYSLGNVLRASAYHKLGIAYRSLKNYNKALSDVKASIVINKRLNATSTLADNYILMGILMNESDRTDSAEFYFDKAARLYTRLNAISEWFYVYNNLGDVEFKKGNYTKCLDYNNRALKILVPGFNPTSLHSCPCIKGRSISDKKLLLILLSSKASTFLHIYELYGNKVNLDYAYQHFVAADSVITLIRSEFLADASKMTLAQQTKSVYEKAIETCWNLYKLNPSDSIFDKALVFSEKSRAIVLLDAIRKIKADNLIPAPFLKEEKKLNLLIHYYEKQLALNLQDDKTYQESRLIIDTLLICKRKYASLMDSVQYTYPNYFNLIYSQETLNNNEIVNFLTDDQSLVEYFVGEKNVFTFCVNKDTALFLQSDAADSIKSWARNFNALVQKRDLRFTIPAFKLYSNLIKTVEERKITTDKLIIVPDGVLSNIPFDALVTGSPQTGEKILPTVQDYFLFLHQVSYAFSASALQEAYRAEVKRQNSFLGIAPLFNKGFKFHDDYFDLLNENRQR